MVQNAGMSAWLRKQLDFLYLHLLAMGLRGCTRLRWGTGLSERKRGRVGLCKRKVWKVKMVSAAHWEHQTDQ